MNIFTEIEQVHTSMKESNWCSLKKAQTLAAIVFATRPAISVEIGVWYGKSLIPVALAHKSVGIGTVIAIDPWRSSCSITGQSEKDAQWWGRQEIHEQAFASFKSKVNELGLCEVVQIHRMQSDEFDPPEGIGLLSVDGNHAEQAIKDIQRYAPKIKLGGFLVADDLDWSGGSVQRAIGLLPDFGFSELYRVQNSEESWAVFQRLNLIKV